MDGLETWHPVNSFLLLLGAAVLAMVSARPSFLLLSVFFSAAACVCIRGRKCFPRLAGAAALALAVAALNPVFNTRGETALFALFGRPYTLEALGYGAATGCMLFSVLAWFACWETVMTGDKLMALTGWMAPAASLLLTMVLRLVPAFRKKAAAVVTARRCAGLGAGKSGNGERAAAFSALAGWALESGVVTSDAMRSRGWGLSGRTSFGLYRFRKRDGALLAVLLALLTASVVCLAEGGGTAVYFPAFASPPPGTATKAGLAAYGAFLALPVILKIRGDLKWRYLRSKI